MPDKSNGGRKDERLKFVTKCQLEVKGTKYDCLVEDISTVGASIKITDTTPHSLQVGEEGTLNVLLLSQVKYVCRVVRINAAQIGLQFV